MGSGWEAWATCHYHILLPSFAVPENRAWRLDQLGRAQDIGV